MRKMLFITLLMGGLCTTVSVAKAQERLPEYLQAEKYTQEKLNTMLFSTVVDPHWFQKGNNFWFEYKTSEGTFWYVVDPAARTKKLLFDSRYPDISDARIAMQKGEIYGFYYIPEGTAAKAQAHRQPKVSFYTNNTLLIAGSLLFKDMKMMSELASGAAARTALYAKGATEEQAMAFLQPIVIDTHPLNNPWLNYSVYLCNTFAPGVLMLLIFMITVYSIGVEIKDRTAREWLRTGNGSIWISLAGKLLPHTAVFFLMGILYNTYLYGFLHFPCNSGILPMLLATLCLVLASQGMGILMIGTLPTLRLGLSFASLWGVLSFSMCGLSFPAMAMHPVLQGLANLFPLRHYFLIYADQALNGYPMIYSWMNYVALLVFMMLPFLVARRLKEALIHYKYLP